MRINKLSNKYRLDRKVNGKRRRTIVHTDLRTAKRILYEEQVNAYKYQYGIPMDITLKQLINEYLKNSKATKKSTTYKKDIQICNKLEKMINTDTKLSELQRNLHKIIDEQIQNILKVENKSPYTVNGFITVVKALFNKAYLWNYLPANPLKGIKKVKTEKNPRPRIFSDEEIKKILEISDYDLSILIKILIHTGLRVSELLFLEWSNVNFDSKKIIICENDIWSPKDYELREIKLQNKLEIDLKKHKNCSLSSFVIDKSCGDREKDRLYRNSDNGKYYKRYIKKLDKVLKKLGIYEKGIGFHTFRHTFASKCIMGGTSIVALAEIMGHSSTKTTMIYIHLSKEFLHDSTPDIDYDI
ncbi:MAG: site-specific integrase [Elusimicrobia bacterium]|nr:site-specific integrase [Candidatus Liberimonas magnetica]